MGWLDGEVALVTGGGSGIGLAVVRRYVAEGARVVVADLDPARLGEVQDELGDRVTTVVTDVRDHAQNVAAVAKAVSVFGKLDVLVANAGMGVGFAELADIPGESIDTSFDQIFAVNVKGVISGAKAALPELLKTRGSIVVTLSNSSFFPDGGGVLYIASKHAALGVVRQLAHEFAPYVRVNGVAPGATQTNFTNLDVGVPAPAGKPQADGDVSLADQIAERIRNASPLRVYSEPSDHAAAYLLLGSRSQSPSMSGTVISSDGGLGVRGIRRTRGGDDLLHRVLGE
ncbi:SDR family NAD(P)-dependent oxidoreductase [Nocardia sp. NPDC050408]|uniref:SDR family NAD(P)-dependent oxidoreductase n=1 Tax=Nocardia sp. NPDC050408 TaxID=3364319 RepID=UPI003793303E